MTDIKITIDLGEGKSEDIVVKRGQENDCFRLAGEFCVRHGYDGKI